MLSQFSVIQFVAYRFSAICALVLIGGAACHASGDYADLFRSAAEHSQHGEYEAALSDYRAALALQPNAPEALNNCAVLLYQLKRYREAFAGASKAWKIRPELTSAALVAGMSAVQLNQPQEAIQPLRGLLQSNPTNVDARLALASAYVGLNQFEQAAEEYKQQLAATPENVTALYGLGICFEHRAEALSAKLSQEPGGRKLLKLLLAQYLQGAGDERLAAEAYGESNGETGLPTEAAQATYEQARAYASEAKTAFEHLVAAAPGSWQAAVFLGDAARQHGDLLGASEHYRRALQIDKANGAALLGLGTACWELGDFDAAKTLLNQTLQVNPRARQAIFELGNIAVRQHRDADSIALLSRYLAWEPGASAARADLGRALLHQERYADAARELSKAAAGDERGETTYELSLALRHLGRVKEADAALAHSSQLRRAQLEREQRAHTSDQ